MIAYRRIRQQGGRSFVGSQGRVAGRVPRGFGASFVEDPGGGSSSAGRPDW